MHKTWQDIQCEIFCENFVPHMRWYIAAKYSSSAALNSL